MPVLAVGIYVSYNYMKMRLPFAAEDVDVTISLGCGYYLYKKQPEQVLDAVFNL